MITAKEILSTYWGYPDFRGSQEKVVNALMNGKDCLALMPTGGGKSLCFQLPALMRDGICIVVSPLVALIQSQVSELKRKGIKAAAMIGGMTFEEISNIMDNCQFGGYKFLYLSPERLQQSIIQERIKELNVNLIAIDEAHCISQWGHDFRPAYLNCKTLREIKPEVPMIALTATATKDTQTDIKEQLALDRPLVIKDSFQRTNLGLHIKSTHDKKFQLLHHVKPKECAIVYVRTRKNTEVVSNHLKMNGHSADFFHGGLNSSTKKDKLDKWLKDEIAIMVATTAFGMGINKSDVRAILHYQIPESIENYFQEVGRAGRDGKEARAVLLVNEEDMITARRQFLENLPDATFLKKLYRKLNSFFQIAYGEGEYESFDFQLDEFCKQYQLNTIVTYNGLKLLDQNSVISLSENFHRRSTVRFLVKKETLFNYLDENTSLQSIVQTLLRTYGGVFDFDTNINLKLISNKTQTAENDVVDALIRLQKDGIINCHLTSSDLTVTFLVPREDDRTINRFAEEIKKLNRSKHQKFEYMLDYIENKKKCRSVFILEYFGEKDATACGKCDICLHNNQTDIQTEQALKKEILNTIQKKPMGSRELLQHVHYDENLIIGALKELLEDEYIIVNETSAYQIKK